MDLVGFFRSIDRYYVFSTINVSPNDLIVLKKTSLHIDPEILRKAAGRAVGALKVLANEDRLLLLCQLSQGEMSVSELEEALDIRQPTLSQQLGVLRNEGVVETRRVGSTVYYSVRDPRMSHLLATARQMLASTLEDSRDVLVTIEDMERLSAGTPSTR